MDALLTEITTNSIIDSPEQVGSDGFYLNMSSGDIEYWYTFSDGKVKKIAQVRPHIVRQENNPDEVLGEFVKEMQKKLWAGAQAKAGKLKE